MITPIQLKEIITKNAYGYKALFSSDTFFKRIPGEERDLNVFIPIRNRKPFIRPCVEYMLRAAHKGPYKVKITLIENDEKPRHAEQAGGLGVDYIFVPTDLSMSNGLFAKSLCYNVGFIHAPRTEWNVFHDIDILVDEDYFQKLGVYISRNPAWLQPYAKRRVRRVTARMTLKIIEAPSKRLALAREENSIESKPGSPGGSILVKSTDFLKVGGYDPELFFGYSPEDSFFWSKLELVNKKINGTMSGCFCGAGTYADDPPIEVYHLDHPLASGNNPHYGFMCDVQDSYWKYNNGDRMDIISLKKDILGSAF
ncbi:MAG: hypothetical protein GF334_09240 [Candidatus Altiarchaeales archaeon]|nr:hypothetical protein [Candidatus Altiarchaeales archaeon]